MSRPLRIVGAVFLAITAALMLARHFHLLPGGGP